MFITFYFGQIECKMRHSLAILCILAVHSSVLIVMGLGPHYLTLILTRADEDTSETLEMISLEGS